MTGYTAWVADCHLQDKDRKNDYHCHAAVWADGFSVFREKLIAHISVLGYRLLWIEECLPASQYIARHGMQAQIAPLARKVHPHHSTELGQLKNSLEQYDEPEGYLHIAEHNFAPLPDQKGIPFWEQEWITEELKDMLFAQSVEGSCLRTYLIVDAALRKKITGFFDLDNIDVPIECLFRGEEAVELREVAPHLIDMTLPTGAYDERDLVPEFHKSFFKKHWEAGTGIVIRCVCDMKDVCRHFRKFTKYETKDERSFFFRFWETNAAYDYFTCVNDIAERSKDIFYINQASKIDMIVAYSKKPKRLYSIKPNDLLLDTVQFSDEPFTITEVEEEALMKSILRGTSFDLCQKILEEYPEHLKNKDARELEEIILQSLCRMHSYGIYKIAYLRELAEKEIFLGSHYETKDPTGQMKRICQSDMPEDRKFSALMNRLLDCEVQILHESE